MAHNPPKGPGKGPGNGNPPKPFGKAQDPKAAAKKSVAARQAGWVRDKFRAYRQAHPELETKPETLSKKAIDYALAEMSPEALGRLRQELQDMKSPKGVEAAKAVLEHVRGRPMQAVELAGPGGTPLRFEDVTPDRVDISELISEALTLKNAS